MHSTTAWAYGLALAMNWPRVGLLMKRFLSVSIPCTLPSHVRRRQSLGVRTNPAVFEIEGGVIREGDEGLKQGQTREVGVFPLLSWYHASWDQEPDLPAGGMYFITVISKESKCGKARLRERIPLCVPCCMSQNP